MTCPLRESCLAGWDGGNVKQEHNGGFVTEPRNLAARLCFRTRTVTFSFENTTSPAQVVVKKLGKRVWL